MLTIIHKAAFNGSEIGKLWVIRNTFPFLIEVIVLINYRSLKGNSKLRMLHELAFEGIANIREL